MPMHTGFADWYRAASLSPPQELLEQRWLGVEEAAGGLKAPEIISLLRLYSTRQQPAYKAPPFLDAAFRKHDTSFPASGNTEELRVLAGSILRQVIESVGAPAVAVALGLVCSSYGTRRATLPAVEHVKIAEKFIAQRALSIREVKQRPVLQSAALPKERYDELLPPAVFAANATPNLRDPLFNILNEQASKINQNINRFTGTLWNIVQAQREELNLLWWLQNKFSRDLQQPFSQLTVSEASLVLATEVADLTTFIPGPAAVLGILVSALDCAKDGKPECTILGAVNSSPRPWRELRAIKLGEIGIDDLCPVLLAISKSLETDGERDWLPVYRKISDVHIEEMTPPIRIALQLYTERLFLRAISELKE